MTAEPDNGPTPGAWAGRIHDARGRRVVFLSHCLLNEDTRYPGGACAPGAAPCVLERCAALGLGIVQMPCPKQHAWGGVGKRHLLRFFGEQGTPLFRARRLLLPALLGCTRVVYRRLARRVAYEVTDGHAAGVTVVAVVGVDGSPSCGVWRTLDTARAIDALGALAPTATAEDVNRAVLASRVLGEGLFTRARRAELQRHDLPVPLRPFDLPAELRGDAQSPDLGNS